MYQIKKLLYSSEFDMKKHVTRYTKHAPYKSLPQRSVILVVDITVSQPSMVDIVTIKDYSYTNEHPNFILLDQMQKTLFM